MDLLFPSHIIPSLSGVRGMTWKDLIDNLERIDEGSNEILAFTLLMARLAGCATCNADSFRAIHGCTECAKQTIRRFHGSDKELVALFDTTKVEVHTFLHTKFGKTESTSLK